MTIKLVTYFWILGSLVIAVLLFVYFPTLVIAKHFKGDRLEADRLENAKTYTYPKVIRIFALFAAVSTIVSSIIYLESGSGELAVFVYAFLIACTIAGMIRTLSMASHVKNRGPVREE
jgi:hypothetical protein